MHCLYFVYIYGIKCPDLKCFSPQTSVNSYTGNKLANRRSFSQIRKHDSHCNKHRYKLSRLPFCLLRKSTDNCKLTIHNAGFLLPIQSITKLSHTNTQQIKGHDPIQKAYGREMQISVLFLSAKLLSKTTKPEE